MRNFWKKQKKLKDTFESVSTYLIPKDPRTTLATYNGMMDEERTHFCEVYNNKLTAFEHQYPGKKIQVIDLLYATLDELTAEAENKFLFKGFERYI